jgi:hypothetical protein
MGLTLDIRDLGIIAVLAAGQLPVRTHLCWCWQANEARANMGWVVMAEEGRG